MIDEGARAWAGWGDLGCAGSAASGGRAAEPGAVAGSGGFGQLGSVFPPLSPVAWTGVMTGKNSGKHGVFEFLEYGHDPLKARVNSSRSIQADLALGDRRPARQEDRGRRRAHELSPRARRRTFPGFYLGDFLSPEKPPISRPIPRFSPSWSEWSALTGPGPRPFMTAATRPR